MKPSGITKKNATQLIETDAPLITEAPEAPIDPDKPAPEEQMDSFYDRLSAWAAYMLYDQGELTKTSYTHSLLQQSLQG